MGPQVASRAELKHFETFLGFRKKKKRSRKKNIFGVSKLLQEFSSIKYHQLTNLFSGKFSSSFFFISI